MTADLDLAPLDLKGPQIDIFYDDRRFIYYKSGRGCGKTVSACMRIARMIDTGELRPGARILVMGPTYPQLKKGTLESFDRWLGDYPGNQIEPPGANLILEKINGNEPERRLVGGITAYFRNASNVDQTRSHEVQLVWLDEAAQMKEQILQLTNANLRQFGAHALYQTILTSTPRGKNWLWRQFVNPETRMDEDKLGFYHITTVEAEELGIAKPGYVEEMGYLSGTAMYEQEILGMEVAWTGNVFHYQPERDTPYDFTLPKFVTVAGGIDIGTTAPTAVVLVGIDEAGRYWIFREYYQRRADFHDVLKLIGDWHREYNVRFWAIDAAANLEARMMRAAGFPVFNSMKARDAAGTVVNFVNSLMERGMFRISPDCPALIAELETYEHKEYQSGDEVTFLDKVKPNQPDHAIDAMRYCIGYLSSYQARRDEGSWGSVKFVA